MFLPTRAVACASCMPVVALLRCKTHGFPRQTSGKLECAACRGLQEAGARRVAGTSRGGLSLVKSARSGGKNMHRSLRPYLHALPCALLCLMLAPAAMAPQAPETSTAVPGDGRAHRG